METAESFDNIRIINTPGSDIMIHYPHTDMGQGLKDGYCVYASGGVFWTLPIRTFY